MSTESVIEKVKKLRRLATSSNIHEAAAAAAAADKLIQEHGLAEAELEGSSDGPRESPTEEVIDARRRWPSWVKRLYVMVAKHYDCVCYIQGRTNFKVVGRPSDIASVRYMTAWLVSEIERLAQQQSGNGRSFINSFRHGAVVGVITAMRESKKVAREQATSAALVVIDNRLKEANAHRAALAPDLKSARPIHAGRDAVGFFVGREAGRGLHRTEARLATTGSRALGSKS